MTCCEQPCHIEALKRMPSNPPTVLSLYPFSAPASALWWGTALPSVSLIGQHHASRGRRRDAAGRLLVAVAVFRFCQLLLQGSPGLYVERDIRWHCAPAAHHPSVTSQPGAGPVDHFTMTLQTWTLACVLTSCQQQHLGSLCPPISLGFSVPWRVVSCCLVTVDQP